MSTENMEAPEIYSGKIGVEIVPDMRKLRRFAKDFIALVDSYWPEETGSPLATQSRQPAMLSNGEMVLRKQVVPWPRNPGRPATVIRLHRTCPRHSSGNSTPK